MIRTEIKKELSKYFKDLPLEPYEVMVNYDEGSGEDPSNMWVVFHEFENNIKKGYLIAYEKNDKDWHVIEWINNQYEHVCIGGKSFVDALRAM